MAIMFEYLESEGCGFIRETVAFEQPVKDKRALEQVKKVIGTSEADKGGRPRKNVAVRIAAIHDCITKNFTEYHADELKASIPTWTGPYNKPVITDHNAYEVDRVVGRIMNAEMGKHAGKECLIFSVLISDKEAAEKVLDGRFSTVSIGARVKSAVCSVCGNDWAKGNWCEHEPGHFYLKDPEDPNSQVQMTLIMGGIQGHEVSFVTVPADENAMIIAIDNKKSKSGESDLGILMIDNESIDYMSSNGEAVRVASSVEESGRAIIESVMGFIAMAADSNATGTEEESVEDEVHGTETDEETTDTALEQDVETSEDEEATAAGADADDNTDADESADADADADADESDADADADQNDENDNADDAEEGADGADDAQDASEDAGDNADDAADDDAADDDASDAGESDDDTAADADAADESDNDSESEEDSENVASVTDELRATLVTLYIERGIANGSFASADDVNVEELLDSSIDDLRSKLKEQAGDGPTLSEKLAALSGSARTESKMVGTDGDKTANANVREHVVIRVVGKSGKKLEQKFESTQSTDSDEGVKGVRIVKKNNR